VESSTTDCRHSASRSTYTDAQVNISSCSVSHTGAPYPQWGPLDIAFAVNGSHFRLEHKRAITILGDDRMKAYLPFRKSLPDGSPDPGDISAWCVVADFAPLDLSTKESELGRSWVVTPVLQPLQPLGQEPVLCDRGCSIPGQRESVTWRLEGPVNQERIPIPFEPNMCFANSEHQELPAAGACWAERGDGVPGVISPLAVVILCTMCCGGALCTHILVCVVCRWVWAWRQTLPELRQPVMCADAAALAQEQELEPVVGT